MTQWWNNLCTGKVHKKLTMEKQTQGVYYVQRTKISVYTPV